MRPMKLAALVGLAIASATSLNAADTAGPAVVPLLAQALPNIEGKEVTMLTVEYGPGGTSSPHRHNANTFVYVLEGSVVMQVTGGKLQTLTVGQTFYESPTDIHSVSRNASATQKAKILVFMLK